MFEYLHEYFYGTHTFKGNTSELQEHLNCRGVEGWELVTAAFDNPNHADLIFKREIK